MPEQNLIWMSLVVFLPSVFALGLLFFPKGYEEAMRWWSLFGTALTLGVSICAFILYKAEVVDTHGATDKEPARTSMSLLERTRLADIAAAKGSPPDSKNWI